MGRKNEKISKKVGLELSVALVLKMMKSTRMMDNTIDVNDLRIGCEVPIYLTAVIEDMISSIITTTSTRLEAEDRTEIKVEDLWDTIENDINIPYNFFIARE